MGKEPRRPARSQRCSQCGNAQSHDLYGICPAELGTSAWDPCDFDTCPRQKVPGTDYCSGHQYPDERHCCPNQDASAPAFTDARHTCPSPTPPSSKCHCSCGHAPHPIRSATTGDHCTTDSCYPSPSPKQSPEHGKTQQKASPYHEQRDECGPNTSSTQHPCLIDPWYPKPLTRCSPN